MLPCTLPTVPPTEFALDLQPRPFCTKQGIPTQQSNQLTIGLYRLRKSFPKITSVVNPSNAYKSAYIVTLHYTSLPDKKVSPTPITPSHTTLVPFAIVTVSLAPFDMVAYIAKAIREWTKLCVAPLSNKHQTYIPAHSAYNPNKFGHVNYVKLEIWAYTGGTSFKVASVWWVSTSLHMLRLYSQMN